MAMDSGQELYQHLQNLDIFTGKLTAADLSTWYDTADKDTLDFLNWFTSSITPENILTASEKECYNSISENITLTEERYNELIAEVEYEYPGIFDVKSNELEIKCLEEELKMYKDELKHLEKQNVTNRDINKVLQKKLSKNLEKEAGIKYKVEETEKKCLEKAIELKDCKTNLQKQLMKYSNMVENFSEETNFLSNINTQDHNKYVRNVGDGMKSFVEKSRQSLSGSNVKKSVCLSSCSKVRGMSVIVRQDKNDVTFEERTEDMQKRLEKVYLDNVNAKMRRDELQSIHDYLHGMNIGNLPIDFGRCDKMQSMMNAKEEEMFALKADIQKVVSQVVRQHIDSQKYPALKNETDIYEKKLNIMKQVNENMDGVVAYVFVLYMLLNQERQDIKSMEKFFRDFYQYMTFQHHNQEIRIKAMEDVTNRRKEESFSETFHLVSLILTAIKGKTTVVEDLSEAIETVQDFKLKCRNLEKTVFCNDFFNFKKDVSEVLKDIHILKNYLTNGPTSEYVVLPHRVYTLYKEVNDMQAEQEYLLKFYLQLKQSVEDKLSKDKWLKYRTELWMYFLEKPHYMHAIIEYIQQEVEKNVKASFK